jgi:hypothetical protein
MQYSNTPSWWLGITDSGDSSFLRRVAGHLAGSGINPNNATCDEVEAAMRATKE